MNKIISMRGRSLEDAFFRKRDEELLEQQRKLHKMKQTLKTLQEVSGIHNSRILNKLMELEVSPALLASIAVVPLVEVAWADGKADEKERRIVLEIAAENGIKKGSTDYDLLENWLKHRPTAKLLEAWTHYIAGICENMSASECKTFETEILDKAKKVAQATGGVMGVMLQISPEEKAILKKMEKAFSCSPGVAKK
ncbi:MAG: TerB family tellurite resistance protein [Candidatus Omnitrophica bacterium]|nr:TerB family tellurite resistance protein [Candidatus Omnitrophota bacterium]